MTEQPTRVSEQALTSALADVVQLARKYIAEDFVPESTYEVYGIMQRRMHCAIENLEASFHTHGTANLERARLDMICDLVQAATVIIVHLAEMAQEETPDAPKQADDDADYRIGAACLVKNCGFVAQSTDDAEIHWRETGHTDFRQEDGGDLTFGTIPPREPATVTICEGCGQPWSQAHDCGKPWTGTDTDVPDDTGTDLRICDGCAVREGWEHKCHGAEATVQGERAGLPCECPECAKTPKTT